MENKTSSKAVHITLWVAQVLLAAIFIMSGFMKASTPVEQLSAMIPWASDVPLALVRFIGTVELLGGIGLLLPSLLRIKPMLTVLASAGLAIIMFLAIPFHVSRGEAQMIGVNALFMLIALFVVWGRWKKAPILAK